MFMAEKYDFTQFDVEELRQKKHPITWKAFWINFNLDSRVDLTKHLPYYVSIPLDCDGAPVPTTISREGSNVHALNCPGAEWSFPDYTSFAYLGKLTPLAGIILDKRSWLDIIRGCCPDFD